MYNYLGLSGDARVNEAAVAALSKYGTSVSASRIASGERPVHGALEAKLAEFLVTADRLRSSVGTSQCDSDWAPDASDRLNCP